MREAYGPDVRRGAEALASAPHKLEILRGVALQPVLIVNSIDEESIKTHLVSVSVMARAMALHTCAKREA